MITLASPELPVPELNLDELYRSLSGRLEQIVRREARYEQAVIEDACQFAWSRLMHHRGRVHRECVLSWLVKTATHEAFKLAGRSARDLSLDETRDGSPQELAPALVGDPGEQVEQRLRLESVRALSERQQQMLWLHALGHSYVEIARYTGCTPRTVERQLLRAKRSARQLSLAWQ